MAVLATAVARNRPLTWWCYIVRCADETLYTGVTNNLDRRVAAHNAGTASRYTRVRRPVSLVFSELHANRSAALKREAVLKRLPRSRKLELARSRKPELVTARREDQVKSAD